MSADSLRPSRVIRRLAPLLLLVLTLGVAACSGGSSDAPASAPQAELTLEQYFQELDRIADDAKAAGAERAADIERRISEIADDPSEEEALDLLGDMVELQIVLAEERVEALKALDPPAEVEELHDEFVASIEDSIDELEEIAGRIASADSAEDIADLLGGGDWLTRAGELALALQPCFELQQVAIDNDIDANLACSPLEDPSEPLRPSGRSEFLTPVADAQGHGITPYWFGDEFVFRDIEVRLSPTADFAVLGGNSPGISLMYAGEDAVFHISLDVKTFPRGGGGVTMVRDRDLRLRSSRSYPVQVGSLPAELITVPTGNYHLYIDIGDVTVVILAPYVEGVNPLADSDRLIAFVAENLRPYPE
jgi:hypothetical protein